MARIRAELAALSKVVEEFLDYARARPPVREAGATSGASSPRSRTSSQPLASTARRSRSRWTGRGRRAPTASSSAARAVNLVRNAVEAAPAASVVEIAARTADGEAVIEVADRGAGLARGGARAALPPVLHDEGARHRARPRAREEGGRRARRDARARGPRGRRDGRAARDPGGRGLGRGQDPPGGPAGFRLGQRRMDEAGGRPGGPERGPRAADPPAGRGVTAATDRVPTDRSPACPVAGGRANVPWIPVQSQSGELGRIAKRGCVVAVASCVLVACSGGGRVHAAGARRARGIAGTGRAAAATEVDGDTGDPVATPSSTTTRRGRRSSSRAS